MPGGNPNHDPKNGEFTTGAGGGQYTRAQVVANRKAAGGNQLGVTGRKAGKALNTSGDAQRAAVVANRNKIGTKHVVPPRLAGDYLSRESGYTEPVVGPTKAAQAAQDQRWRNAGRLTAGPESYRSESEARSVANSLTARGFQAQVREGGTHGYQVAHNAPSAGAHQVHDYIMAKGGPSPNVSGHNVIGTRHVGGKRHG